VLIVAGVLPAAAQSAPPIQGTSTTIPELTGANTIIQMVKPVGAPHGGDALALATKLAVGTAPLASSSGGFEIKLDPSTGLQVRTATTFGPSFSERALTSGEGKVSIGVNFMSTGYDHLGSESFSGLQLRSVAAANPTDSRSGVGNITETANTVVVSGRMGVTDRLDIGAVLPIVSIKIGGSTQLMNGNGNILTYATGTNAGSGLGDIAGIVKYRFYSFGDVQPDPGGLAVMATIRLPTGDTENLRGLGVTRTLVSLIASSGQGRFRPHGNVGFEGWSKGVTVASDDTPGGTVTARHQLQYAAGLELEAAPKCTVLVDFLGSQIFGGGKTAFQLDPGSTTTSSLVALPEGLARMQIVPGVKVNLKAKLVLSANALVTLKDDGLHARVTPMAGIDLTF
jgi:hypothetical protein